VMLFFPSHSRDVASSKLCRISRGTRIMVYPPCMSSDNNVFFISLDLTLMRRLFIFIFLCSCQSVFAEKHEIGLTLGGLLPQDLGTNPNAIRLGAGSALQVNYGRRLINGPVEVSGEVHFLANAQRVVGSTNPLSTRDVATIYVTPGIRVKFAPTRSFSPYLAAGGGIAWYQQSLLQQDGRPNTAPRNVNRGAVDFGGGVDTNLWRWIG